VLTPARALVGNLQTIDEVIGRALAYKGPSFRIIDREP